VRGYCLASSKAVAHEKSARTPCRSTLRQRARVLRRRSARVYENDEPTTLVERERDRSHGRALHRQRSYASASAEIRVMALAEIASS